jgi:hypothetical protein
MSENVEASTSRNSKGLHGLYRDNFTLPFVFSSAVRKFKIRIHKAIILPVVLYGCETWSLDNKRGTLTVFVNRVLRRIFGPKRDEETGG